ncbi:MAG TPA: elongation factor P maturation arginine rhamnosyltransferase EarP [Rectinemataceae bacterium]|nr:elongation factor P maturation arginine rhamnosyltransferase EarP [Rectinemataceae bacterium]
MTIDILCKVVDNFGDIGVVYRLARALSELDGHYGLRLIVDDLGAFRALDPSVDPSKPVQALHGWTVVRWDEAWEGFRAERPRIVLECFACGRPDWYEDILFDPTDRERRTILSVEHLTAEAWAPDFHRLASATRSGLVRKWMFMPGFQAGTGGLVAEAGLAARLEAWRRGPDRPELRRALARASGLNLPRGAEGHSWLTVFSYERDYGRIVAELSAFARDRPLLVLVAAGRSAPCFAEAWRRAGEPFPVLMLPFLRQEAWDELLMASDFAIVRGEDSLARAALYGLPFLWHAYLQEGAHQVVKVRALMDRMRPHFASAVFAAYEAMSIAFNDRLVDGPDTRGEESILPLLGSGASMGPGFAAFSAEILGLGNLAANLVTFLGEIV